MFKLRWSDQTRPQRKLLGPESAEHTTIIVTLEPAIVHLGTPPTPGDTSLEVRAPTPPTLGTPVVWDLFESAPGSTNNLFSPPTPGRGAGGDTEQSPFLSPSLSPTQGHDSPPTPGRTVTQVDRVAQTVAELEVSDPVMAAFVAECDARDARAPTAPPHQGYMTPRDERVSIQSKGIKKTFPRLWLPVSLCGVSRPFAPVSVSCVQPYRY